MLPRILRFDSDMSRTEEKPWKTRSYGDVGISGWCRIVVWDLIPLSSRSSTGNTIDWLFDWLIDQSIWESVFSEATFSDVSPENASPKSGFHYRIPSCRTVSPTVIDAKSISLVNWMWSVKCCCCCCCCWYYDLNWLDVCSNVCMSWYLAIHMEWCVMISAWKPMLIVLYQLT